MLATALKPLVEHVERAPFVLRSPRDKLVEAFAQIDAEARAAGWRPGSWAKNLGSLDGLAEGMAEAKRRGE